MICEDECGVCVDDMSKHIYVRSILAFIQLRVYVLLFVVCIYIIYYIFYVCVVYAGGDIRRGETCPEGRPRRLHAL